MLGVDSEISISGLFASRPQDRFILDLGAGCGLAGLANLPLPPSGSLPVVKRVVVRIVVVVL